MPIYKLLLPAEYEALVDAGHTLGAPVDLADGFIHFSTAAQLEETARRHFRQVTRLWVLEVDGEALGDALKWEPSRGGALFPHLYGTLFAHQVRWAREVQLAANDSKPFAATEIAVDAGAAMGSRDSEPFAATEWDFSALPLR